jgi:hypothetical protein
MQFVKHARDTDEVKIQSKTLTNKLKAIEVQKRQSSGNNNISPSP